MKLFLATLCGLTVCAGCTATGALKYRTINQSLSVMNARYQEVMDNLALTAANRGTLPSFSTLDGGMVNLTNQYGFDPTTHWSNTAFASQMLGLSARQVPDQQWTVTPVAEPTALEAAHYACLWGVYGPPPLGSPAAELLRSVRYNDDDRPHFGVDHWFAALPPGWLGIGGLTDVPVSAPYRSHCGSTHVWVCQQNLGPLSDFTLAILDIATTDPTSITWKPAVASIDVKVLVARRCCCNGESPAADNSPGEPRKTTEPEAVQGKMLGEQQDIEPLPSLVCGESPCGPCNTAVGSKPTCPITTCPPASCKCPGAPGVCFIAVNPPPPPPGSCISADPADPDGKNQFSTTLTIEKQICQDEKTLAIYIPEIKLTCTDAPTICFVDCTTEAKSRAATQDEGPASSTLQPTTPRRRTLQPNRTDHLKKQLAK